MDSRYARPQVAAVSLEGGWNPAHLLIALVLGLMVGVAFGLRDEIVGRGIDRDESYLVLASTLYGQDPTPAAAASLRQRLVQLGFANPSLTVLKLADRFAASRDRQRQREADGLRIFGEALSAGVEPTAVAHSAPTAAPQSTGIPTVAPAAGAVTGVSTTPAPQPAATATSQPAATPAAVPATTPEAQGTPAVTKSADKVPVRLRKEPSTQSAVVAIIPYGASVQVLRVVNGSASDPGIDPKELRWYQVKWGSYTGYIYYKLIAVQE